MNSDPFSVDERRCPDCNEVISTNIVLNGKIETCADHASFEALQEAYRWLRGELKRSENRFHELARGTALEKALAELKEANWSRARLGAERYLLESRSKYWQATAEEYELALRRLIAASGELIKAEGGESGK